MFWLLLLGEIQSSAFCIICKEEEEEEEEEEEGKEERGPRTDPSTKQKCESVCSDVIKTYH